MKSPKLDIPFILIHVLIIAFLLRYFMSVYWSDLKVSVTDNDDYLWFYILFGFIPLLFGIAIMRVTKWNLLVCYMIGFVIQWILFLNVNPYPISMDNKLAVLEHIPEQFLPGPQYLLSDIRDRAVEYPIIVKPIRCSGCGSDVNLINSDAELNKFLMKCDDHKEYMVQRYLNEYQVELGILYERLPWESTGKIVEIIEKTQPDIVRTWDPGFLKNHYDQINDTTNRLSDDLSKMVPGITVARYDLRLKSIHDLHTGDFKILEINGTMGMPLSANSLTKYLTIDTMWYFRRLFIGASNIALLRGYSPWNLLVAIFKSYKSVIECHDWENLYSLYS